MNEKNVRLNILELARRVAELEVKTAELPTASADTKGGVKIGEGLTMTGEVLSVNSSGGGGLPDYNEYDEDKVLAIEETDDGYAPAWEALRARNVYYTDHYGLDGNTVQQAVDNLAYTRISKPTQLFAGQVFYDSSENAYKNSVMTYVDLFNDNAAPSLIGIDVSYVVQTNSGPIKQFAVGHAEFDPQFLLDPSLQGFNAEDSETALQAVVSIPISRVSYMGYQLDALNGSKLTGYINFNTDGTDFNNNTYKAMFTGVRFEPNVKVTYNGQETAVDDIAVTSSLYVRIYKMS